MQRVTKESFLEDVKNHSMRIIVDNNPQGYYHVIFQEDGDCTYKFEIVVIPGKMFYTGDVGSFVFGRENTDMIKFFGSSDSLRIDYWDGKCLSANSLPDGIYVFDIDEYKQSLFETLTSDYEWTKDEISVLDGYFECSETLEDVHNALHSYTYLENGPSVDYELYPAHTGYSDRFLWCLYALNWGCEQIINFN